MRVDWDGSEHRKERFWIVMDKHAIRDESGLQFWWRIRFRTCSRIGPK